MDRLLHKIREEDDSNLHVSLIDNELLCQYGMKNITLRPYQVDGVNWLLQRYHRGHGCILGDEMGLGKTCQTISLLAALSGHGETEGPHLILSPLSVLNNWKDELNRFAPFLKVITYVGDKETRPGIRKQINNDWKTLNVVLTTYELCLKDSSFLQRYQWNTLVVDEGHRLKNRASLLHQSLLEFDIGHHLLLTGTPIQNNMLELYSLLCFVAPKIFKERYKDKFVEMYGSVESDKEKRDLHDTLKPFLLRRIKSEVVKDLPKKSEVILYHGLSALQKKFYKAILTKDIEVFENQFQTNKTRLLNVLMQLRKCVNHPYLFDGVEPEPFILGDHLVDVSGKLVLIDELLQHLQTTGHKVLMFSQMTHMLDILQDYLGYRGYNYERLDGSVRGEERYLAIRNFNQDEDTFVFLLSTKAGGQGLNLVAADTVIFVDSDFNPQNDLQAAARAHRIGQTRPVKVMRLIGRSTVEEIILHRAEAKLELTNTVIEGGQFSLGTSKESLLTDNNIQLQDILKFGVDRLLDSEDSSIEDLDLEAMLGSTKDGQWLEEPEQNEASVTAASVESTSDSGMETMPSMYMFEGMDYSKEPTAEDVKAFDQLLQAEKAVLESAVSEGRPLRTKKTMKVLAGLLPDPAPRKARKQISQQELDERKRKREETKARRAKEAEEEEIRRAQEAKKKLQALWDKNNYESCNITLDSEGEESDGEEEDNKRLDINYISGDVTHPQHTGDKDSIVVHCVDDSGKWGQGGVFSAISSRSLEPEKHYAMAGKMKDLALGDTHLISIDDRQKRTVGRDYLAVVVAQHRDKRNNLSGIKLSALSLGLQRIYKAAKEHSASVHLPRIGHNTAGFNWYGTERLIRKHLSTKGIPTYIYYYPRKKYMKRKPSFSESEDEESPVEESKKPSMSKKVRFGSLEDPEPSTSNHGNCTGGLPSFMEGTHVYFHGLSPPEVKKYSRYLIAYNGDVDKYPDDTTTHIVANINSRSEAKGLEDMLKTCDTLTAEIVKPLWLHLCFTKGQLQPTEKYIVRLDEFNTSFDVKLLDN